MGLRYPRPAVGELYSRRVDTPAPPEFAAFVHFLQTRLNHIGPEHEVLCEDIFRRAIALEKDFFDSVYQGAIER